MKLMKKTAISTLAILGILSLSLTSIVPVSAIATDITDDEITGILFMREEEKLARDVYLTFAEMYPSYSIFSNIATSEQQHMDSIKRVIDRYDLTDPVGDNGIGEFTDDSLQDLYDSLIQQGSISLIDALQVGATIEEIDILDLKEYIDATDNWMINRIYTNLLDGSENHLRAFVKELEMQGTSYQPLYLDEETYNDIIDADSDSGHNGPIWDELMDWIRGLFRWRYG